MIGMLLNVVHRQVHKKTFNKLKESNGPHDYSSLLLKIRVSQNLAKLGGGHKMSGMEGRENWSKCTCVI